MMIDALRNHPLVLIDFGAKDSFFRHTEKIRCESKLVESPNGPFGGIELPGFDAISIIRLKFVVIIVVAFSEGEQSHNRAVSGRVF